MSKNSHGLQNYTGSADIIPKYEIPQKKDLRQTVAYIFVFIFENPIFKLNKNIPNLLPSITLAYF